MAPRNLSKNQLFFLGFVLVFGTSTYSTPSLAASIYDELNDSQKNTVQQGEQVLISEDVGQTWPKVTLYERVNATPEEALAVMSDYELHSSFFKNLGKSKISKNLSKTTKWVDYTLQLPWPLHDENYTLKDQLRLQNDQKTYSLNWSLVRADSSKNIQGGVRFETLGTSSIMAYQNLVVPSSGLAGLLKNQAIQAVKEAAEALAHQIEKERADQPDLLQKQVTALRLALELGVGAPSTTRK